MKNFLHNNETVTDFILVESDLGSIFWYFECLSVANGNFPLTIVDNVRRTKESLRNLPDRRVAQWEIDKHKFIKRSNLISVSNLIIELYKIYTYV